MKIIVSIISIYLFNCAFSYPGNGYHEIIGIPKARQLMEIEGVGLRIVGGSQVSAISAYPYQAGIVATLTTGWTSICGGALLSNTRVLTAAHCWWDGQSEARQFTIVLGSLTIFSGGTRITTSDVVVHPSWNTMEITNDIAMVKITSVSYSNNIQAIPLPAMADVNLDFSGLTGTVAGYGKTSDSQNNIPSTTTLHHVNVNIITNTECQKSFDITLHGSHLCTKGTGGVGTCEGDSGSPLTVVQNNQRILVGIVSFGLSDGCQAGLPSVYTRATAFHDMDPRTALNNINYLEYRFGFVYFM